MKNDAVAIKIQEFDILRALAIIMLMVHHSEAYGLKVFGFSLEGLNPYFEAVLLGIFFFISGYFTGRSFSKRKQRKCFVFFLPHGENISTISIGRGSLCFSSGGHAQKI